MRRIEFRNVPSEAVFALGIVFRESGRGLCDVEEWLMSKSSRPRPLAADPSQPALVELVPQEPGLNEHGHHNDDWQTRLQLPAHGRGATLKFNCRMGQPVVDRRESKAFEAELVAKAAHEGHPSFDRVYERAMPSAIGKCLAIMEDRCG